MDKLVGQALAAAGDDLTTSDLAEVPADVHRRRWFGPRGTVVLDVAVDPRGHEVNRHEVACRSWAAAVGVQVPEVLASSPDGAWFVSRQADPLPSVDEAQVLGAVEVALRVQAAKAPAVAPARTWRAPRRTALGRIARTLTGGVPMADFLVARRAAAALPCEGAAHGDLHRGNLLAGSGGALLVVDWEYLAAAPMGTDALRLWATLDDPALRALLLARLHEEVPVTKHAQLRVLGRWVALRSWAEAADERDLPDRARGLVRARAVFRDLQEWT